MTVGEKIQYYRKKTGLSQEGLGQKMLVSRQTVSLWEMDKTMPTVDNLLLLKEIFSVSVDDILSDSEPTEKNDTEVNEPKEKYVFEYEKTDTQAVFKKMRRYAIIRLCIFFFIYFISFSLIVSLFENDAVMIFLELALLFCFAFQMAIYFIYRSAWKKGEKKILENKYLYEVFDGYFTLNIYQNDDMTKKFKVYFGSVEKIQSFGNYFMLQIEGQGYIIKKDALLPDSVFFAMYNSLANKPERKTPTESLKIISTVLFVLSVLSVWMSTLVLSFLSDTGYPTIEGNMWIFFLFLPIPISSIIFGFCLKKKGYKYKKNIIVGVIVSVILCFWGSFTFVYGDIYSHDDEPIANAEKLLGIDIPEHLRIDTLTFSDKIDSEDRVNVYSDSNIYFDSDAVEEFEKNLDSDTKWISDLPNDMVGITSNYFGSSQNEYYIIYNKDTGEINKLPSINGTYDFISVLYNTESNIMYLTEYWLQYTK